MGCLEGIAVFLEAHTLQVFQVIAAIPSHDYFHFHTIRFEVIHELSP